MTPVAPSTSCSRSRAGKRRLNCLLPALLVLAPAARPQAEGESAVSSPREQARSMVISKFGIVATSQTLASQAGATILERGGNAVDAAIAANATLGLVQPYSNGIGGDLFVIYYEAGTRKLYGLNASGWAPSGLSIDFLRSKGLKKMPGNGIYSVTVPGAVAGWEVLRQRFGRLRMAQLLEPAIYYADHGFPVTELIAGAWKGFERSQPADPNFRRTYLVDGKAPRTGQVFRNPDLAASLRRIAAKGRDGFYRGPTAEAILQLSREHGGTFTPGDLYEFQPEWVDPVSTTYRGWTVWELPPNGYGLAALAMLNLMERFPLAEYGHNSARALHVMIEAKKLAYADMLAYVGDPRFTRAPVAQMISKAHAAERAGLIRPDRANCEAPPARFEPLTSAPGNDTIYMSAIDQEGNIVSLIQSNFGAFGSALVPPGTGFVMQNRGSGFTLEPGRPNSLAPHKRPLHTIIPAFMENGEVRIGFGIMGGWNQAQARAQFVSNLVDFGMNLQAAVETARFTKLSFGGCDVAVESRISPEVRAELTRLGHELKVGPPFSAQMGRGQAVMRDANGVNYGASDPRGDGAAVPQGPPLRER